MANLDSPLTNSKPHNTAVIIYDAKNYQIKHKTIHKYYLSLNEPSQLPHTFKLHQQSKYKNDSYFYQNNMINNQK